MNREELYKKVVDDVLEKIKELDYENKDQEIIKYLIEILIIKLCESEEKMNDYLRILDSYTRRRDK